MKWLSLLPSLWVCACAVPETMPASKELDRVEAALVLVPCVGQMGDWDRRYYYTPQFSSDEIARAFREDRVPKPTSYDESIIEIDLRQANFEEFASGRKSYSNYPPGAADNDDRHYRSVFGTYDLNSGKLTILHCGANMSPP